MFVNILTDNVRDTDITGKILDLCAVVRIEAFQSINPYFLNLNISWDSLFKPTSPEPLTAGENLVRHLYVNMIHIMICSLDTSMWEFMVNHMNGGIQPDLKQCFYVGDAAGRPSNEILNF
jgi:hypothetical protein